jgi:hypothetical protein
VPVSDQVPINVSTANGVTTVFPYTFKLLAEADLEVQVEGVTQALNVDYTVSGVGVDGGGAVTFLAAPGSTLVVSLRRAMALERTTSYDFDGDLPADVLNSDQDAPVMMIQQLAEGVSRSIQVPPAEAGTDFFLPPLSVRKGKLFAFDPADGSPVVVDPQNAVVDLTIITQPGNDQVFAPSAKIQRINDVLLVGGATDSDRLFPNVAKDWLSAYQTAAGLANGTVLNTQAVVLNSDSPDANVGFIGGSRSLHFASALQSCIGIFGAVVNNHATLGTKAWAFYGEAHRDGAGAADTYGMELDVRTRSATITPTPWQMGDVVGIQLAVGAELTAVGQFDASAGISFAKNPMRWKAGIVFQHDALLGTDGASGQASAIVMAPHQQIEWQNSTGALMSYITSRITDTAKRSSLVFNDVGAFFVDGSTSGGLGGFAFVASAVNYPVLTPSTAGNPVTLDSSGSDANRDIWIKPAGTGVVRFGTYTASGDVACNGSISIKDAGGTVRKLMTTA